MQTESGSYPTDTPQVWIELLDKFVENYRYHWANDLIWNRDFVDDYFNNSASNSTPPPFAAIRFRTGLRNSTK